MTAFKNYFNIKQEFFPRVKRSARRYRHPKVSHRGLTYCFSVQSMMQYVNPYKLFPMHFQSFLQKIFMAKTWQYNRNTEWIATQPCVCVSYSPKQIYTLYMPKNASKIIIKTISCCYILRMLIQQNAEDFHAKNMANQSKLQLSLLEMEQHNLLLIATAYKFMQLKYLISKETTAGGCMT